LISSTALDSSSAAEATSSALLRTSVEFFMSSAISERVCAVASLSRSAVPCCSSVASASSQAADCWAAALEIASEPFCASTMATADPGAEPGDQVRARQDRVHVAAQSPSCTVTSVPFCASARAASAERECHRRSAALRPGSGRPGLDLGGALFRCFGQRAHFVGHHGKALAMFARARRLDRGIERQQVGLVGNAGHGLDDFADVGGLCFQVVDDATEAVCRCEAVSSALTDAVICTRFSSSSDCSARVLSRLPSAAWRQSRIRPVIDGHIAQRLLPMRSMLAPRPRKPAAWPIAAGRALRWPRSRRRQAGGGRCDAFGGLLLAGKGAGLAFVRLGVTVGPGRGGGGWLERLAGEHSLVHAGGGNLFFLIKAMTKSSKWRGMG
jgi:hypothetical protein